MIDEKIERRGRPKRHIEKIEAVLAHQGFDLIGEMVRLAADPSNPDRQDKYIFKLADKLLPNVRSVTIDMAEDTTEKLDGIKSILAGLVDANRKEF